MQVKYTPGTHFTYKEWDTILLSVIISKVCDRPVDDVIKDYFYTSLEIDNEKWKTAKCGICGVNCTCNVMTAVALAKVGRFMLQGGIWNGKRILSEEYIKLSVTPSEINNGYAFLW